ncbi:MAG: DUF5320 domain-containing protein [Acidobacteriota bacterium]
MPYGDRRGPDGYGPRSGRGLGYCNDFDSPGYTKGSSGRGFGRRNGNNFGGGGRRMSGRGFSGAWGQPYEYNQPADEKSFLDTEIKVMEKNLESMKKRLEEIDKKK